MRRLALIGVLAALSACSRRSAPARAVGAVFPSQQVTWGGASVLSLAPSCDGGFADAGEGITDDGGIIDAGFKSYDGGVCADGGTHCQSCSGTCLADGGWQDGGFNIYDGGPQDGGFNGNIAECMPASDAIDMGGTLHMAISCPLLCPPPTSSSVTAVLRGANQDQSWSWIPGSQTSAVCVDGGLGDAGLFWDLESSFEFIDVLVLANGPGDGGLLPCSQFKKSQTLSQ